MPKIDYYIDTFSYFSNFNPSIQLKTILDYGSNYGLFLDSSEGTFDQCRYTGVDVDQDALTEGKKLFPNACFVHYNKYNVVYNKLGQHNLQLNFDKKFDVIISYSVLTHTTIDDFFDTIDNLYKLLNDGGQLLLTYLDVNHKSTVEFFKNKRIKDFGYCDNIETVDYTYLIDNKTSKEALEGNYFLLFLTNEYLKNRLSNYNIQLKEAPTTANGCFQSCLIIDKQRCL